MYKGSARVYRGLRSEDLGLGFAVRASEHRVYKGLLQGFQGLQASRIGAPGLGLGFMKGTSRFAA